MDQSNEPPTGAPPPATTQSARASLNVRQIATRQRLRETAQETVKILPRLLDRLGTAANAKWSTKHTLSNPSFLSPAYCPLFAQPATIRVLNDDTLNVGATCAAASDQQEWQRGNHPYPAVVNFCRHDKPGGGWLNGALAQEESLCYRSSLSLSLHYDRHYPLSTTEAEAVYSPYVVIIREDLASGHGLLEPSNYFAVSVISVPAIRKPDLRPFRLPNNLRKVVFRHDSDRNLTKDKMRLVLRMAAFNKHRRLVLGALGCGVYENPPEDVAHCWLEVLRENEFSGHWWRDVCFAVYDPKNEGNYEIFKRVLDGQQV